PLVNTPVAGLRPSPGGFQSLPVLTQIYPNFPANSPQFPPSGGRNWHREQARTNVRIGTGEIRGDEFLPSADHRRGSRDRRAPTNRLVVHVAYNNELELVVEMDGPRYVGRCAAAPLIIQFLHRPPFPTPLPARRPVQDAILPWFQIDAFPCV